MDPEAIQQVRRFNRIVTQRVGALDEAFLQLGRPLGQARLLWEISDSGCDVRELRARLGLDSGYLSRLLAQLQGQGLVTVEVSAEDRRVRIVRLSEAGGTERDELERRSDSAAEAILTSLGRRQQSALLVAMAEVERLLTASLVEITASDPATPDARYCLGTYFSELTERFKAGFDPTHSPVDDAAMRLPAGLFLVARLHGEPVGCGALLFLPTMAKIKRMWVSPSVRGLGVGRKMLTALESEATGAGATVLGLETNNALPEAIAMYESSGYREVEPFDDEPYAHRWFLKEASP
jgi:DNA-binding MarR family transcriptional regulator